MEEQRRLIALLKEKRQAVISHAVTKGLDPVAPMKSSGIGWLGDIPAHWDRASLYLMAERVVVGIAEAAATHAYCDTGVPILRSTNVRRNELVGEILHVLPEYAQERGSKLIGAGDLITVRTGSPGVTAVVPEQLDGCQCFTMLITTLKATHVPEYVSYFLNGASAGHYFDLEAWGSAQKNISVPILKAVQVPVLTLDEQRQIVSYLDRQTEELDALILEVGTATALLQERLSALISAAVTGKIDVRDAMTGKEGRASSGPSASPSSAATELEVRA